MKFVTENDFIYEVNASEKVITGGVFKSLHIPYVSSDPVRKREPARFNLGDGRFLCTKKVTKIIA